MAPSEAFTRLKELGAQWASSTAAVKPALDALHDALPSCGEIERAFGLFCRRVDDVNDDASPPCSPQVDHLGRVSCACAGCARWKSYVAGDLRPSPPWPSYPQYEVLTREHVAALAAYLRARAAHYDAARLSEERVPASRDEHPRRVRRPLRVLEVGAGDGRLARYLRVAIQALDTDEARRRYPSPAVTRDEGEGGAGGTGSDDTPTVEIIATDNDARALARGESSDAVIIVDALHAIAAAGDTSHGGDLGIPPCDVVLACWQPMGVDWTATMRAAPGVMEYVLVGRGCSQSSRRPRSAHLLNVSLCRSPGSLR